MAVDRLMLTYVCVCKLGCCFRHVRCTLVLNFILFFFTPNLFVCHTYVAAVNYCCFFFFHNTLFGGARVFCSEHMYAVV